MNLGRCLAQEIDQLNPERVIFGGSISRSFHLFGDQAAETYRSLTGKQVEFEAADDDKLVLYGAAIYGSMNLQ